MRTILIILLLSASLYADTHVENFVNACAGEYTSTYNIDLSTETLIHIYVEAQYMTECSDEGAPQDVYRMYFRLKKLCPVQAKEFLRWAKK